MSIMLSSEFEVLTCSCGATYALPKSFLSERRDDHETFYCPNGHRRHYPQMSDEEKLQQQLEHCQADRDFWEDGHNAAVEKQMALKRSRGSLRGVITRMKKVAAGNGSGKGT